MELNFKEFLMDVEGVEKLVDIFKVVDLNDIVGLVDDIEMLLIIGKLYIGYLSVFVVIGIVINLVFLIWNVVELLGYNKG